MNYGPDVAADPRGVWRGIKSMHYSSRSWNSSSNHSTSRKNSDGYSNNNGNGAFCLMEEAPLTPRLAKARK